MKVMCIDNINNTLSLCFLTVGKLYDVIYFDTDTIRVLDDNGTERLYSHQRFKFLQDIRQDKLNQLL